MFPKTGLLKVTFATFLLLTYWACEPTEEGCLDLLSKNFGFEAVNECDSCCIYPDLKVNLGLAFDNLSIALNDTIDLGGGDSLIVRNVELLLSEFEIMGQSGDYRILDSITINDLDVKDDYVYFLRPTTNTLGQTRFTDTLTSVSLSIGFNETATNSYRPFENIDSDSQIDNALDSLYNQELDLFYNSRISIEIADSTRLLSLRNPDQKVVFDTDTYVGPGVDWTLNFEIDFKKLIEGINANMTDDELTETFQQNFIESLSIK